MDPATDAATSVPPPTSVFLSYSRENRSTAVALVEALERNGFVVWWDGLIEGGHSFADRIESALETADAIVVLWSKSSVRSHWVRDEAAQGRDSGRLVPVSVDGSEPPLGFRQIHYIDLRQWRGRADAPELVDLARAINAAAGTASVRSTPPHSLKTGLSRRGALTISGATVGAAVVGITGWTYLRGTDQHQNSVAVLPFRDMSKNASGDYFSEGLSEELRTTLSGNRRLAVVAGTSSERARETISEPRAIATALNVAYLIQGSVRQSSDLLRITAQIVDGKTGFAKWSESFDRSNSDILALQSEVAAFITDALLAGFFSSPGAERIGGTRNAAAFDAYLRGGARYRQAGGEADDRQALALFDQAVLADPHYAAAHAARSRVLTVIANNYTPHEQIKQLYLKSVAASRQAIRLAPDLAEGHSALGFVLFNGQLDARAAKAPYQRSFELGHGNADILSAYANFAARIGSFSDGRKAITRAQRLDPLNPTVFRNAGLLEFAARDFQAAKTAFNTALSLNPKSSSVRATLGDIALLEGDVGAARTLYDQEPDKIARLRGLAVADMRLSRPDAAQSHFNELLREHGDVSHYQQAQVLAQWSRADDALAALEKAVVAGDAGLVRSRNDPLLDPVRKTVRFAAIQRRLGFE